MPEDIFKAQASSTDDVLAATPQNPNTPPTVDVEAVLDMVETTQRNLDALRQMLAGQLGAPASRVKSAATALSAPTSQEGLRIIEGVFDGQNMVGPDSKQYSVPSNYASKSKLVEGDVMKLTITHDGSFIYKQIGPVDRQRLIATLSRDETTGEYKVTTTERSFRVLTASVTYFKGEVADEVVILVPAAAGARWAAIENIIRKGSMELGSSL